MVMGCVEVPSTGEIYFSSPDVCDSTSGMQAAACKSEITTYGYTSTAFTSPPAGWFDISCPIFATDCAVETEIYCTSSSTCLTDCSGCAGASWAPQGAGFASAEPRRTSEEG